MPLYLIRPSNLLRIFFSASLILYGSAWGQDSIPVSSDSMIFSNTLRNVRVTAYEHNRMLKDVPAAISYIGRTSIQRFGSQSMVQAANTSPGVRMEERSPGSYRFNIRGSSLRSPFGIRNVKVYYNDIPITDPGGNTYLNQLGNYNINSIEIIKGPGSSLYGSGTGGVLLIESMAPAEQRGFTGEYTTGSYGLHNFYTAHTSSNENHTSRFGFQHQHSDGYREQSALRRNVLSWNGKFRLGAGQVLKTSFLYGDLFYETPGALTAAEYNLDPKMARPGSGGFPGAVAAKASIRQTSFLAGASMEQSISASIKNKTVLYGMFTQLVNPNLRGYEKSYLPHVGGRTDFKLRKIFGVSQLQLDLGAEWQQGFQSVHIHDNVNGDPDSLRTSDDIGNRHALVFFQALLDIKNGWTVVAASGFNWYKTSLDRFVPSTIGRQTRRFVNEWAPRLAILKKMDNISVYAGLSKGFSPPTIAELVPTGGAINFELQAEHGINYDLGWRASFDNDLSIDLNAFLFRLDNTIVQRRDAGGGDYFINAGKTNQKGVELAMTYFTGSMGWMFIDHSQAWLNYTYHHFNYREFKQLNSDFSGNLLPGIAPHTLAAGWDLFLGNKIMMAIHYYFSDGLPLNDANSAYAGDYHLWGLKTSWKIVNNDQFNLVLSAGADNLLDEKYSLGNDINGFGGRYYNAAPRRNYFAGLRIHFQ